MDLLNQLFQILNFFLPKRMKWHVCAKKNASPSQLQLIERGIANMRQKTRAKKSRIQNGVENGAENGGNAAGAATIESSVQSPPPQASAAAAAAATVPPPQGNYLYSLWKV